MDYIWRDPCYNRYKLLFPTLGRHRLVTYQMPASAYGQWEVGGEYLLLPAGTGVLGGAACPSPAKRVPQTGRRLRGFVVSVNTYTVTESHPGR